MEDIYVILGEGLLCFYILIVKSLSNILTWGIRNNIWNWHCKMSLRNAWHIVGTQQMLPSTYILYSTTVTCHSLFLTLQSLALVKPQWLHFCSHSMSLLTLVFLCGMPSTLLSMLLSPTHTPRAWSNMRSSLKHFWATQACVRVKVNWENALWKQETMYCLPEPPVSVVFPEEDRWQYLNSEPSGT